MLNLSLILYYINWLFLTEVTDIADENCLIGIDVHKV